jgi:hypothetical protein
MRVGGSIGHMKKFNLFFPLIAPIGLYSHLISSSTRITKNKTRFFFQSCESRQTCFTSYQN